MRPVLRTLRAASLRPVVLPRAVVAHPAVFPVRRTYATDAEEDLIAETPEERKKRLKSYTIRERLRRRVWGDDPLEPPQYEKMYNKEKELTLRPTVDDPHYVEAVDGRGLPIIGLTEPMGLWQVDTFPAPQRIQDEEGVHRAVHRALVETLTLQLNGRQPADMFTFDTPRNPEAATEQVSIEVTANGEVRLHYAPGVEGEILQALQPVEEAVQEDATVEDATVEEAAAESEQPVESEAAEVTEEHVVDIEAAQSEKPAFLTQGLAGEGWINAPLSSPELVFALNKRIMHLTGRKVPDAIATQAKTVGEIVKTLVTPPKPAKLAEVLMQNEALVELPNVKIVPQKIRPLDKEKAIGRAILFPELTDHKYEGVDEDQRERPFKGGISTNWFKKTYKL